MNKSRLIALCLFRDQFHHIRPVEKVLQDRVRFVYSSDWDTREIEQLSPDIVIGINEHHSAVAECYQYAREKGIPTLTLQDGILEWRHMFKNPLYDGINGAPLHQPVLADKIACIGAGSAALIAQLGNGDKIELTGMPKLDDLVSTFETGFKRSTRPRFTFLILTSSKPWFNEEQRNTVLAQLQDIKSYLSSCPDVDVIWRVTKEIPVVLNVKNNYESKSTEELSVLIRSVDAVITTISTTILESQLLERPVAIIDYFNTPNFVYSRWAIRHPDHIPEVVSQMLSASILDKQIQDSYLRQNIEIESNRGASQRVATLILDMIDYSRTNPGKPLPPGMIHVENNQRMARTPLAQTSSGSADLYAQTLLRYKLENKKLREQLNSRTVVNLMYSVWVRIIRRVKNRNKSL